MSSTCAQALSRLHARPLPRTYAFFHRPRAAHALATAVRCVVHRRRVTRTGVCARSCLPPLSPATLPVTAFHALVLLPGAAAVRVRALLPAANAEVCALGTVGSALTLVPATVAHTRALLSSARLT